MAQSVALRYSDELPEDAYIPPGITREDYLAIVDGYLEEVRGRFERLPEHHQRIYLGRMTDMLRHISDAGFSIVARLQ